MRGKLGTLYTILLLPSVFLPSVALAARVNGIALLEGQSDHRDITVSLSNLQVPTLGTWGVLLLMALAGFVLVKGQRRPLRQATGVALLAMGLAGLAYAAATYTTQTTTVPGAWTTRVPDGVYDVNFTHPGYISVFQAGVLVDGNTTLATALLQLPGGSPTPTSTPEPTATFTESPTPSPTSSPTSTSTPTATETFTASPTPTPTNPHIWSTKFGGTSNEHVYDMASDGGDNLFLAGYFSSSPGNFGGDDHSNAGGEDAFIVKYDTNGTYLWSKAFGSTGNDQAWSVAADPDGNVVVVGAFNGTVDFGGGNLVSAGNFDIFVVKLDHAGDHLWSKRFGSTGNDGIRQVATDSLGNIIITGRYSGTVDFGGGGLVPTGVGDIYVAKYNTAGAHQWSQKFGSTGQELARGLVANASGDIFLTGFFEGTVNFGGGGLVSAGNSDIFLVKLDSSGTHVWSQRFGTASYDEGVSVELDSSGNVYLAGMSAGTIDFGGGPLPFAGGVDGVLAAFATNAAPLWSRSFGGTDAESLDGLAVDSLGNAIVTGNYTNIADFGEGGVTSAGGVDAYVVKYSSSNTHVWTKSLGGSNYDAGGALGTDSSNNVIVSGVFSSSVDFGGGSLTSAGARDGFLAKYLP